MRERNPAAVTRRCIEPLPFHQTIEELAANLIICPPAEMIDRLAPCHEAGIDESILSSNLGQPQGERIEAISRGRCRSGHSWKLDESRSPGGVRGVVAGPRSK